MNATDATPRGVARIVAPNPSPFTLDGTNTYVVEGWVIDPGPAIEEHLEAVARAAGDAARGIALTHGHDDHAGGADELAALLGGVAVHRPRDGERLGPIRAVGTPGHSPDHVCLVWDRVCFSGDTVLGAGSVFVAPGDDSLARYLASLQRLLELDLDVLCPGHGPIVADAHGRIREQLEHRLERERKLVAALEQGARTTDELLARAWDDVAPAVMQHVRPAAEVTLAAHLEKLAGEGRLPEGVEAAVESAVE